jgi:hypothetical protein
MKKFLPLAIPLLALVWIASALLPERNPGRFDLAGFGRLPVLADGRLKPIDTIARTGLLMLQGRQRLDGPGGAVVPPVAWILDVFYRPATADAYPVFRIDNPDVLSLFNLGSGSGSPGVRFSFQQLQPKLDELDRQAQLAGPVESAVRSPFQRAVIDLREHVELYVRLRYSLQPADGGDFLAQLGDSAGLARSRNSIEAMETFGLLRPLPPVQGPGRPEDWQSVGRSLLAGRAVDPRIRFYAALGNAWRNRDFEGFNRLVAGYHAELASDFAPVARKCAREAFLNRVEPFTIAMVLYLLAFFLAAVSWLRWPEELGASAFRLMQIGFVLATTGIIARMALEGRPPVTNLYSSALFIGWGSVALCLILERINRNAVASSAGGLIGFGTLIIAHHLALSGDTMEMMRAVLDSNFWLSTHVVTVTTGYASTFIAGFLELI